MEKDRWNLQTSLASPCMTKVRVVDFHYHFILERSCGNLPRLAQVNKKLKYPA